MYLADWCGSEGNVQIIGLSERYQPLAGFGIYRAIVNKLKRTSLWLALKYRVVVNKLDS